MPSPNAVVPTVVRLDPPLDRPAPDLLRSERGLSVGAARRVESGQSKASVIAAEREGLKYVRTAPDDTTADNLPKVKES